MTNYVTTRPLPLGAISTYRIVNFFDTALETLKTKRFEYKTARALNALSDFQLEDIGLSRGDIERTARIAGLRHF